MRTDEATAGDRTAAASRPPAVVHSWTAASGRELMTHVHEPVAGAASAAVVLLDGLARDAVLGYRSYRMLAERLAASGRLAIRFAFSGTGDSGAPAPGDDRPSTDRWVEDLDAVVARARATAPGAPVVLVALRASGLLATRYASEHPGLVDQVVLWEPVGSGRVWLRGQETLHRLSAEFLARESYPALPEGSAEVAGRLFSAMDAAALRALRLAAPAGVRLDVVQRPAAVVDRNLSAVLEQATSVTELEGQAEALDAPTLLAVVSLETLDRIVATTIAGSPVPLAAQEVRTSAVVARLPYRGGLGDVVDEITAVDGMHAVVTHAVGTATRALVTIPGSGEPMDGPTGLWTHLARTAAARGVTTLRMDRHGVGEMGDPAELTDPWPYRLSSALDFTVAYDWFRDRTGLQPVLTGVCSGSWIATQVALRTHVDDIIAVNLIAWDLVARPEGNALPAVIDLSLVVATPDAKELSSASSNDLRIRVRAVAKTRTPGFVWRYLGRRGKVQMPEPLLDAVTARGTRLHQVLSSSDLAYADGQQLRTTMRRLAARGRDITLTKRPELDHALLSAAGRDRAVSDILALLNRVAPGRRGAD